MRSDLPLRILGLPNFRNQVFPKGHGLPNPTAGTSKSYDSTATDPTPDAPVDW